MELLDSPIRAYAWGSRTAIAAVQGRAVPSAGPEAELWMGAHPDSPSTVQRSAAAVRLDDAIAADPASMLGPAVDQRFGARLPFMLKLLAAASPLSLQAHPDTRLARARYAQEAALPAAERQYTDPYAKPELLVALGPFDAVCGFRDPSDSAADIAALDIDALAPVVAALRTGSIAERLRAACRVLLDWPVQERAPVVAAVAGAASWRGMSHVADLAATFLGDMGVVATLLLNHVVLREGEGIWMPPGNLHAYLAGTGMEVLAASDNVLRGGLTIKRVDVAELLGALRFEVLAEPVVKPVTVARGVVTWRVPAREFALLRVRPEGDAVSVALAGPRIVFCQAGSVIADDGVPVNLRAGQSAFGAAGRPLSIGGSGTAFVATTGE